MSYKLNGREVEIEVSGYNDEIEINAATYTDTGEDLTDDEVDELMNIYACDIAQAQDERGADDAYDRENDR